MGSGLTSNRPGSDLQLGTELFLLFFFILFVCRLVPVKSSTPATESGWAPPLLPCATAGPSPGRTGSCGAYAICSSHLRLICSSSEIRTHIKHTYNNHAHCMDGYHDRWSKKLLRMRNLVHACTNAGCPIQKACRGRRSVATSPTTHRPSAGQTLHRLQPALNWTGWAAWY